MQPATATIKGGPLVAALLRLRAGIESSLTSYDLFAAAIISVLWSHTAIMFSLDFHNGWAHVIDRMLLPVFIVSVGYNARPLDKGLLACAAAILCWRWFLFHGIWPHMSFVPMTILVNFALSRAALEPLMDFAVKSKIHFWGVNAALVLLIPWTHSYITEYGTLCLLLMMAGWLARNRAEIPEGLVSPREYFFFVFVIYIAVNQALFVFTLPQLAIAALGTGYVFTLLYNFRPFILNGLKRRPKDAVEKLCAFLGHKSLLIYTAHTFIFYALFHSAIAP